MRFSTVVDGKLYLLSQQYVQDMYYKRIPYRQDHEQLIEYFTQKGSQVIGSTYFPLEGATYIFHSKDESHIQTFMRKDPYVQNKLVLAQEMVELEQFTQLKFDRLAQILTYR